MGSLVINQFQIHKDIHRQLKTNAIEYTTIPLI